MTKRLSRLLRREQFVFLGRDRAGWQPHLDQVRAFFGAALQGADPSRPVLILGAGSGLEVPWALAPPRTTGWDADPWSRVWTCLRHRRWAPWVFEDLTGGLAELEAAAGRALEEPWSRRRRNREAALRRLTGLILALWPDPAALRAWIAAEGPGTILVANVAGQIGVVAERLVEAAFGAPPWGEDPAEADPLAEALEVWTARAVRSLAAVLGASGAEIWMVHDRAVVFGEGPLALGPWDPDWTRQLQGREPLEVADSLAGVGAWELLGLPEGEAPEGRRWVWPVAPGQRHVIEALVRRGAGSPGRIPVAAVNPCPRRRALDP